MRVFRSQNVGCLLRDCRFAYGMLGYCSGEDRRDLRVGQRNTRGKGCTVTATRKEFVPAWLKACLAAQISEAADRLREAISWGHEIRVGYDVAGQVIATLVRYYVVGREGNEEARYRLNAEQTTAALFLMTVMSLYAAMDPELQLPLDACLKEQRVWTSRGCESFEGVVVGL